MSKYNIDNICIGNHKEDDIHYLIMEFASDFSQKITEQECEINDIVCCQEESEGNTAVETYTEDAQEIFNHHYDNMTEALYSLVNKAIDIHEKKQI